MTIFLCLVRSTVKNGYKFNPSTNQDINTKNKLNISKFILVKQKYVGHETL